MTCFFLVAYFLGRIRRSLYVAERLAASDPLTGVYNRRHLLKRLSEEMERAKRLQRPLSVLLADIDHFKKFNDTFGHQRGDFVLEQVARILRSSTRKTDIVARYGGEEFVVVLPDADEESARMVGERLRGKVAAQGTGFMRHISTVTISVGVATWNQKIKNPAELIDMADKAMYLAKDSGRNQVSSLDERLLALAS
jgi:diguanylate cyclase (GGDEF)-like protein